MSHMSFFSSLVKNCEKQEVESHEWYVCPNNNSIIETTLTTVCHIFCYYYYYLLIFDTKNHKEAMPLPVSCCISVIYPIMYTQDLVHVCPFWERDPFSVALLEVCSIKKKKILYLSGFMCPNLVLILVISADIVFQWFILQISSAQIATK